MASPEDYTAARVEGYDVHVTTERPVGSELGIVIAIDADSRLQVTEVKDDGLIAVWNKEHPGAEVHRGHWILSVNGVGDSPTSVFAELRRTGTMHMVVSWIPRASRHRDVPAFFTSRFSAPAATCSHRICMKLIKGPGTNLGCNLRVLADELRIVDLGPGLIADWNSQHPDRAVRVGDSIVFVNGANKDRMLTELYKQGTLTMIVRRASRARDILRPRDVLPITAVGRLRCGGWAGKGAEEEEICGFCLEGWSEGMPAMLLPCCHAFHPCCLIPWLTDHSVLCPTCGWAADCERDVKDELEIDALGEEEDESPCAQGVPSSLTAAWVRSRPPESPKARRGTVEIEVSLAAPRGI